MTGALVFILLAHAIGCFIWGLYYWIEYDVAYSRLKKKKHAAQMLFYTPAWPVLLSIRAYHGIARMYRIAFLEER